MVVRHHWKRGFQIVWMTWIIIKKNGLLRTECISFSVSTKVFLSTHDTTTIKVVWWYHIQVGNRFWEEDSHSGVNAKTFRWKSVEHRGRISGQPPKRRGSAYHSVQMVGWGTGIWPDFIHLIYFRTLLPVHKHILVHAVAQNGSYMNCRPVVSNFDISDSCLLSHTKFWTIIWVEELSLMWFLWPLPFLLKRKITLQGTNISHQWKRKLIFPTTLGMGYVSFRVIAQLPASTQRNLPGNRKLILPTWRHSLHVWGIPRFFASPFRPCFLGSTK